MNWPAKKAISSFYGVRIPCTLCAAGMISLALLYRLGTGHAEEHQFATPPEPTQAAPVGGGFLGIGARRVAVPVTSLQIDQRERLILPDGTMEKLWKLPEFTYGKSVQQAFSPREIRLERGSCVAIF